ncbi:hypothetical protein N0V94_000882 [Neodidymelliopsis sp. IMI 364377]|nr:hypothetical protein N0V94_000882 [Neodidymelliopsis sp. IMI 364377]
MGLTDHKIVAKFINGGLPPPSAVNSPELPPYQVEASQPPLLRNDELQKTGIYLNLPTQGEREEIARLERERRMKLEKKGGRV